MRQKRYTRTRWPLECQCPKCGAEIESKYSLRFGDTLNCPSCNVELGVVESHLKCTKETKKETLRLVAIAEDEAFRRLLESDRAVRQLLKRRGGDATRGW